MEKTLVLKPRLSEKAFAQSQAKNTYVFVVPTDATKHTVARAVAAQFEVTVTEVNITNVKGKAKRSISKGGRRVSKGSQSDIKKAYVTLKEGDSLPIFAAEEQAAEEAAKADEKATKKAAKEAKKENK
jgi:large subunit ribosomal protein L23